MLAWVVLVSDDEAAIEKDYDHIRELETKLDIEPAERP